MTIRERMLSVYHRKTPDRIPVAAYDFLIFQGETEREIRNKGLGLVKWCPISPLIAPAFLGFESRVKDVEVSINEEWEGSEKEITRTFHTPIGSVSEKYREDPGYHSKWKKKYIIEEASDYPIAKFIIENSTIHENFNDFLKIQDDLGDDGVVMTLMSRCPLQEVIWGISGPERLLLDLHDTPDLVEDLMKAIEIKLDEMYEIAARSPADVIWSPDNITGDLNSPKLFKKYCLPFYNKQGRLLHKHNKAYVVHMDGRLKSLKDLIKQADIDVVESFSLPETGGDLPLEEAISVWGDKSIAANLPASLCLKDEQAVRRYIERLLIILSSKKNMNNDFKLCYWLN